MFERHLKISGSFEHPPVARRGRGRGGLLLPPHGRGSKKAARPCRRLRLLGAPQAQKRRPFPGHPSAKGGHAQRRFPSTPGAGGGKSQLLRTTRAQRSIVSCGARDQVNRLGGAETVRAGQHIVLARYREARSARTPASPPHAERHTSGHRAGRNVRQTGALPQLGLVAIATEDRPGRSPSLTRRSSSGGWTTHRPGAGCCGAPFLLSSLAFSRVPRALNRVQGHLDVESCPRCPGLLAARFAPAAGDCRFG